MSKKFTILILAFTLFLLPTITLAAPLFKDIPEDSPIIAEITYLIEKGILTSDPTTDFGGDTSITRIQAVEILINALAINLENRPTPDFVDVNPTDEYFPLIAAIVDEQIMSGNAAGEFKPNDPLTRGQMAIILTNAFKLTGTTTLSFQDVDSSHWANESIQALIANKITTGYPDNTFKPDSLTTKSNYVVFLARILNPVFRKDLSKPAPTPEPVPEPVPVPVPVPVPKSCEEPSKKETFKVNVSVTSLWNKPNMSRKVDRPSTSIPVDIKKWTKDMSLSQKWWLVGKTDTQALYGDEVTVLKSTGNWVRVAIKDQYVPYQKEGYPGWVPKTHIKSTTTNYTNCSIAIVISKVATLYNNNAEKKKFMDISYSTILPIIKEDEKWFYVQTPGNIVKLLSKKDAKAYKNYAAIPKPSQKDIVNEAKRFLDLPYLWAGTSAYGFDCSGIIYAVYKNHGILIPRDSFYQATKGTAVSKKNLQPGDLVFFAGASGKGKVYHVGLYVGSGKMLHAPNASSKVKIESMNAGAYKRNYAGARRYLENK